MEGIKHLKTPLQLKLEEAILTVKGLKLELRRTDLEIDNI